MRYKVLWIDDDYTKQLDFIGEAEQEGIDIDAVESHEEGMELLFSKTKIYHAVILDAKVKNKKNDTVTGLTGLTASRDKLIEINKNDYLPYFIFTGQPDYQRAEWFNETFGNYYIKALDNEKLFHDIKTSIVKQKEYTVQKKFKNVFDIFSEKYLGTSEASSLMEILINLEYSSERFNDEKYFNSLRKIVELVFRYSNKIGLLHDKCIIRGNVNLTWSSLFMAGKEVNLVPGNSRIWCQKRHFPSLLSANVKTILEITSAASHTQDNYHDNERLNFTEYKSQLNSNFLLYSLAFQVMDLLLWFKKYADDNPDIGLNKALWRGDEIHQGDWQKGVVLNLNRDRGYAFFKPLKEGEATFIPPQLVTSANLKEGDNISVLIEEYQDTKSKEIKRRVKEIRSTSKD